MRRLAITVILSTLLAMVSTVHAEPAPLMSGPQPGQPKPVVAASVVGLLGSARDVGPLLAAFEATGVPFGDREIPGPFRPFNVTGSARNRDRFHSLVTEYGLD